MKLNKIEVYQQVLHEITEANEQVRRLQQQPIEALRHRPRPEAWSALDCVEHMNLFYDDYLPRVEAAVQGGGPSTRKTYSPGFFGKKMIASLRPQQGKRRMKIKTFKKMTPHTDDKSPRTGVCGFLSAPRASGRTAHPGGIVRLERGKGSLGHRPNSAVQTGRLFSVAAGPHRATSVAGPGGNRGEKGLMRESGW